MESPYNLRIKLVKRPDKTYPATNDIFQLTYGKPDEESDVKSEQVLVKNKQISIDAAMRVWISGQKTYMKPVEVGDVMPALCIGEVIFSRHSKFDIGDLVMGMIGWQNYCILDGKDLTKVPKNYPNPQHFLGVLGISGLTAYFGMQEVGQLQGGETVLVSAAAGGVGEIAIQLAKVKNCKVIGLAGSDEKCSYVKETLGADECINYKDENWEKRLRQVCPKGIDVYFDNVGGEILDEIINQIRQKGRIVLCGAISTYNSPKGEGYALKNYSKLIIKSVKMEGFLYMDYRNKQQEAIQELMALIREGKLKFKENVLTGLDNAPAGLQRLLQGKNEGKVMIRVYREDAPKL